MYGNQTHFLTATKISENKISELKLQNLKQKNTVVTKSQLIQFATLIIIYISLTQSVFAGSKNPKLAGGNGNATGRSN
jgi:hypothetical protein